MQVAADPQPYLPPIPEEDDEEAARIFEELASGEEPRQKRHLSPIADPEVPAKVAKFRCECMNKCIRRRCPCRASGEACGQDCHTVANP